VTLRCSPMPCGSSRRTVERMTPVKAANKLRKTAPLLGLRVITDSCCRREPAVTIRARKDTAYSLGGVLVRGHETLIEQLLRLLAMSLTPWELDATPVSIEVWAPGGPGDDHGDTAPARIFGTVSAFLAVCERVPDLRRLHMRPGYASGDASAAAFELSWEAVAVQLPADVRETVVALSAEWSGSGSELLEAALLLLS
jgi:hypothetical protein